MGRFRGGLKRYSYQELENKVAIQISSIGNSFSNAMVVGFKLLLAISLPLIILISSFATVRGSLNEQTNHPVVFASDNNCSNCKIYMGLHRRLYSRSTDGRSHSRGTRNRSLFHCVCHSLQRLAVVLKAYSYPSLHYAKVRSH